MESQLVSKVGVHWVSIAVEKLFLKIVLHFVSSTVVQCLENVGTKQKLIIFSPGYQEYQDTLFDDSDVIVLGVTGGVCEVWLALQSEVISQG